MSIISAIKTRGKSSRNRKLKRRVGASNIGRDWMSKKGVSYKRRTKAEQTARNAGVCRLGDA